MEDGEHRSREHDTQRLLSSANASSQDAGQGEEARSAGPGLSVWQLAGICYFAVSGGPYGFEETLRAGGGRYTLIGLAVIPFVWSIPIALMTTELSAMIPETGGHIIWVDRGLGKFASHLNSLINLFTTVSDNALYPVLFVDYLDAMAQAAGLRSLSGVGKWGVKLLLLAGCAVLNMRGIELVGDASVAFGGLVLMPFVVMVLMGARSVHRLRLKAPRKVDAATFLTVLMWNTSGFDSAGTCAAEVRNPAATYPAALMITVVMVTLTYLLPTLVALPVLPDAASWEDGSWVAAAKVIAGEWLGEWLGATALASALGMLCTLLCTSSRLLFGMSSLGHLPAVLQHQHPRYRTPHVAIAANAAATFLLTGFSFDQLAATSTLFYLLSNMLRFLSLLRLRYSQPNAPRPFRIPGGLLGVYLCSVPQLLLCAGVLCTLDRSTMLIGASTVLLCSILFFIKERLTSPSPLLRDEPAFAASAPRTLRSLDRAKASVMMMASNSAPGDGSSAVSSPITALRLEICGDTASSAVAEPGT